jgi:predicted nucleotidyltransferase
MGTLEKLMPATRRKILTALFRNPGEEYYLREIIREAGKGLGSVQRELENLVQAGLVVREKRKGRTYFRANPECPIFEEIKGIVRKTAGLVDVLREALAGVEGVKLAFVYGSVARGDERPESDVDIAVIGKCAFKSVVGALSGVQETLGREANPTVYSTREFAKKAKGRHHFVNTILEGEKIFVIGNESDLRRLAS